MHWRTLSGRLTTSKPSTDAVPLFGRLRVVRIFSVVDMPSAVWSQQAEESAGRDGEGKAIYTANRRLIKKVFSAKTWSPE